MESPSEKQLDKNNAMRQKVMPDLDEKHQMEIHVIDFYLKKISGFQNSLEKQTNITWFGAQLAPMYD